MKVRKKRRFVIELDDAELNAFYDWLAKLLDSHIYVSGAQPKIVDDLKSALYGHRHGI